MGITFEVINFSVAYATLRSSLFIGLALSRSLALRAFLSSRSKSSSLVSKGLLFGSAALFRLALCLAMWVEMHASIRISILFQPQSLQKTSPSNANRSELMHSSHWVKTWAGGVTSLRFRYVGGRLIGTFLSVWWVEKCQPQSPIGQLSCQTASILKNSYNHMNLLNIYDDTEAATDSRKNSKLRI